LLKKILLGIYIAATIFFAYQVGSNIIAHYQPTHATVQYINIGQGDASLITTESGRTFLIDSGNDDATSTRDASIINYLRNSGVTHIDVAAISHYDSDHSGGMRYVAYYYHPQLWILPKPETADEQSKLDDIEGYAGSNAQFVFVSQGDKLDIGNDFESNFIWYNPDTSDPSNDRCVVMQAQAYGNHFLYTGDITSQTEDEILANVPNNQLVCNVLKVAHHGSQYSSSPEFLAACQPVYAVISVGKNTYGQPTQGAMDRITAQGATLLRTDQDGTITFTASPVGIHRVQ